MFTLNSWYKYEYYNSKKTRNVVKYMLDKNNVIDVLQELIISYIICPQCSCLFDTNTICNCWIIHIYFKPENKVHETILDK